MIKRRDFIINSILTGAGLTFLPSFGSLTNFESAAKTLDFSGIVPASIIYDVARIANSSKSIQEEVVKSLQATIHQDRNANYCLIASAIPVNNEAILKFSKALKGNNLKDDFYYKKLAFTTGWIIMKCKNDVYSTIYNSLTDNNSIQEMNLYQSAHLIKMIMLDNDYDNSDLEELLNVFLPRTLGRMHTLKPDIDDGKNWLQRMANYRDINKSNLSLLSRTITEPNQQKVQQYINSSNFYNHDELSELKKSVANDEIFDYKAKSLYAKIISSSIQNLHSLSGFFSGSITEENFKSKLFTS